VTPPADRAPPFAALYSAFAAAYFLSYLYRTINAVISPELTRELSLAPGSLGFLTSAYFVAFALMQLPLGMLLDRYGPRRVEPALLSVAATGALLFAYAGTLPGLAIGRAIIGAGVAACLMAPLKGLALWYPKERHGSLAGWIMVAGGLGALAATAPLEVALRFMSWRMAFVVLAGCTYAVAAWLWLSVPDVASGATASGVREQWRGVQRVLAHPRFWWIAPLGGFGMGAFMAIQGLWAVTWMMDVGGLSRATAASHLLVLSVLILGGYLLLGLFAASLERQGIRARHLFVAGFSLNALALAMLASEVPGAPLWWALYGFGASANVLAFSVLNEGFPAELAGRANTALNLMMFTGSFVTQWGIGVVVDAARQLAGVDTAAGLRYAFALVTLLDLATLAWFLVGWKRYAGVPALRPAG